MEGRQGRGRREGSKEGRKGGEGTPVCIFKFSLEYPMSLPQSYLQHYSICSMLLYYYIITLIIFNRNSARRFPSKKRRARYDDQLGHVSVRETVRQVSRLGRHPDSTFCRRRKRVCLL